MRFTVSLTHNHEFRRLYYRGKFSSGKCVAVHCMRNRTHENRLGITVGTKIGGAVVRNLIRRRIREIYRLSENELRDGMDIVIVARPGAAAASYSELNADVRRQLKRLGLFA